MFPRDDINTLISYLRNGGNLWNFLEALLRVGLWGLGLRNDGMVQAMRAPSKEHSSMSDQEVAAKLEHVVALWDESKSPTTTAAFKLPPEFWDILALLLKRFLG